MATTLESICSNPKTQIATDVRFEGKTIVITGAGGQFGRTGCLYFCQRGARVAALDKNVEALQGTLDELKQNLQADSFDFCAYACDVCSPTEVATVIGDQIVSRFGKIDLLWNNAGYQGKVSNLIDYDPADFAIVLNINVTGMFLVLQAVAKQMAKQVSAATAEDSPTPAHAIVNTASVAGLLGTPGMIAYASSKAAVIAMTVCAAKDLAVHKIRVNALSPALIGPGFMWDRQNTLHAELGPPYFAFTPEQVAKDKINRVPLKRLGTVDEVVQSLAFLLSTDASYVTGTNLVVDGGMSSAMK